MERQDAAELGLWPRTHDGRAANKQREGTMLVLTRREGDTVGIGDGITVVVLAIEGGRVRLGFIAPREIQVRRGELEEKPQNGEVIHG